MSPECLRLPLAFAISAQLSFVRDDQLGPVRVRSHLASKLPLLSLSPNYRPQHTFASGLSLLFDCKF